MKEIFISIISIVVFPFIAKELFKLLFNKNEKKYKERLKNRSNLLRTITQKFFYNA